MMMETSSLDYTISCKDIVELEVIHACKARRIYKGLWRYQPVCVKEIRNSEDITNELSVLSKCIHPKIVQFLGAEATDSKTSIVFEYMDNGTLCEYLRSKPLSKAEKVTMMIDIVIGLNYLHKREPQIVLHRDLKPDNILVNQHGEVKIADFGISKLVEFGKCNELTGHTGETGTYVWMSPEVLKHEPYNYKSDMYSIGLILYYIWTERVPFKEDDMNTVQLMFAKFKNELVIKKTDNVELDDIIERCISYDSDHRPTCPTLIDELRRLENSIGSL